MVCERASEKHAMFGSVGIESGSSLWGNSLCWDLGVLCLL